MKQGVFVQVFVGLLLLILLGSTVYFYIENNRYEVMLIDLQQAHADLNEEYGSSTRHIAVLSEELMLTQEALQRTSEELHETEDDLRDERNKNEEFAEQLEGLSGAVGTLDKLAKTDKELLQKYSKVYFLNEHYRPKNLEAINKAFLYNESKDKYLAAEVMPFFEDLMEEAAKDSVTLWVASAFRSFEEQAEVKTHHTITYGLGANTFSADQGYSEHQLGTTVDFTAPGLNGELQGFETTPAYAWLQENAHRFGFTLSYPEDNAYYIFEPWHWRFVGKDLAEELHDRGLHFYDMNQREIDEYLVSLFDE